MGIAPILGSARLLQTDDMKLPVFPNACYLAANQNKQELQKYFA
jgi:hypothetical protein